MRSQIIRELSKVGAIKRGQFTLKSGEISSVYVNLREAVTEPHILKMLCSYIIKDLDSCEYELICGVPYGAWPLATALSLQTGKPTLLLRKEAKVHGTKNLVDGAYKEGQRVLLIEDVVTSGGSVLKSLKELTNLKLQVASVYSVLDRESGAGELFKTEDICFKSMCRLNQLENHL